MIDTLLRHRSSFDNEAVRAALGLQNDYVVATLHRPANVDDPADVTELVTAMHAVADLAEVVIPLHPRGRARLEAAGFLDHPRMRVTGPLGYLEFMGLVSGARAVVTDSGGVQEETTVLGVPCLTLRPNTERPVTITQGTNRLVTRQNLPGSLAEVLRQGPLKNWAVPPLWDGASSKRIAVVVQEHLGKIAHK